LQIIQLINTTKDALGIEQHARIIESLILGIEAIG